MVNEKGIVLVVLLLCVIALYLMLKNESEAFDNYFYFKKHKDKRLNTMSVFDGLEDGSLTPQTLSTDTRLQLQKILGGILNNINEQTGMRYFLRKIDRVNVEGLKKGVVGCEKVSNATGEFVVGARYTVDFFAHELKNQHTRRLLVVFAVNKDNEVLVEHLNLSNALLHKEKDFMDYSSDALILTDETLGGNKYHIVGMNDSSVDYSLFNPEGDSNLMHHKRASALDMGRMLMPAMIADIHEGNVEQHSMLLYPNRTQSKWWDNNGVFYTECHCDECRKLGVNHGHGDRPVQIYDNPTVVRGRMNSHENANHYLFEGGRGNIGVPRGQVV